MAYKIYLKKGEEKPIIDGRSRVYANEVARIEGKDKNGALADVFDFGGKYLGSGYINHLSKILVHIFLHASDGLNAENITPQSERDLYMKRIASANAARIALGYDNCYRVVFAEADDLPALIVDKYADVLVAQFLSLGVDKRKDMISDCLAKIFNPKGIYERSDVSVRLKEGLSEVTGTLYGEVPDEVIIEENGVKLSVDVKHGQKTGYFLDQKENRYAARRYAKGDVLDCFCNSGGFSLNCALKANKVIAVDVSQTALDNVNKNAKLNGLSNITTLCGDVFEELRKFKADGIKFDTVILDPPAFCKSAAEVDDAFRGYRDVNVLGMKLVRSGGYLITCSCSHYMTRPLFEKMLAEAAKASGRTVRVAEIKSQSPDHPHLLSSNETDYLKFFVLNII